MLIRINFFITVTIIDFYINNSASTFVFFKAKMTIIDQSYLRGKVRDKPISGELEALLVAAGKAAGIDAIFVTSGGQPGSHGRSIGSSRHNEGRAADLFLVVAGVKQEFGDDEAPETITKFVTACAARGAIGMGAGVSYMGPHTLHIGFGKTIRDTTRVVWGADGRSSNAPQWLKGAAAEGWNAPPDWVFDLEGDEEEDLETIDVEVEEIHNTFEAPDKFDEKVIEAAIATQSKWNVPASVTLAQWALESAYGESMPTGSNNPFGIKARSGEAHVVAWTTEVVHGKSQRVQAKFRAFPNMEAAFDRHGRLLGTSSYYSRARKFASDPDKFADALTGVYATDPMYGAKLKSIMRSNNLYKFNFLPENAFSIENAGREPAMTDFLHQGNLNKAAVETLQRQLTSLGYKLGAIDGIFGPLTTAALLSFQNDNNLPTTGVFDTSSQEVMNEGKTRRFGKEREAATEEVLALSGSRTMRNARRGRLLSWILGGFGAFGLGNSAIVNAQDTNAAMSTTVAQDLVSFLSQVQQISDTPTATVISRLRDQATTLTTELNGNNLPSEIAGLVASVKANLPASVLSSNPELGSLLDALSNTATSLPGELRTVLDVLPGLFANDTVMQTITYALSTAGSSILPGFGGSLGVLAAGLLGRHFSNRIAQARMEDHKSGGNLNALL
ncbi:glucosaminidase domain-containing protein [Tateyamaria sp. SN3-11]|uniref:glucosaminidase domain-containing protein n=1 Tax=Tateyamaria sp. SN3-11 TaxID=3092147 RepID=UPI0039EC42C9